MSQLSRDPLQKSNSGFGRQPGTELTTAYPVYLLPITTITSLFNHFFWYLSISKKDFNKN
ncbi:hypothetical protein DCCM_3794 [Desulfocucumis palustris]|uniref:Transmembrane protein n=1 Tax=Desulfocucumis palustris TaxID=1898651 RepID=A0A2L2XF81_9FIRM|nr:hypothetical protein DCCM_3794 [Desulfocucumis palustris]